MRRWEAGSSGAVADVAAALGDGEDQAGVAEQLQGVQHGIPAHAVLLLEGLDRRQRARAPLPGLDQAGQDARKLLVCRLGQIVSNYLKRGHQANLADLNRLGHISGLV